MVHRLLIHNKFKLYQLVNSAMHRLEIAENAMGDIKDKHSQWDSKHGGPHRTLAEAGLFIDQDPQPYIEPLSTTTANTWAFYYK